jgi:hypothetical protein
VKVSKVQFNRTAVPFQKTLEQLLVGEHCLDVSLLVSFVLAPLLVAFPIGQLVLGFERVSNRLFVSGLLT